MIWESQDGISMYRAFAAAPSIVLADTLRPAEIMHRDAMALFRIRSIM